MAQKLVLYGSPMCADVPWVRRLLERGRIEFDYVDIRRSPSGHARVVEINDGHASVPTLLFPDGSTLTEPSESELVERLERLGYEIPEPTPRQRLLWLLEHPTTRVLAVIGFAIAYSAEIWSLLFISLFLIVAGFVTPQIRG